MYNNMLGGKLAEQLSVRFLCKRRGFDSHIGHCVFSLNRNNFRYTSLISTEAFMGGPWICTKSGVGVHLADTINCDKFLAIG